VFTRNVRPYTIDSEDEFEFEDEYDGGTIGSEEPRAGEEKIFSPSALDLERSFSLLQS
jgi:hypothetical protein